MAVTKLKLDPHTFDACQKEMATAIIREISEELGTLKLPDDQMKDLVARVAFHVCCLIDGCRSIEKNGADISSVLTFQTNACTDDEVITSGGNSYMHEYVHRLAKAWFEAKAKIGFDL
jgi:hypothetical protein